jgi:hypothetical protein
VWKVHFGLDDGIATPDLLRVKQRTRTCKRKCREIKKSRNEKLFACGNLALLHLRQVDLQRDQAGALELETRGKEQLT